VLSEFSERMAGTVAADDVLLRMARILGEGTGAKQAEVWLRLGSELQRAALWPGEGDSGSERLVVCRRGAPRYERRPRGPRSPSG
jgi:hypothetical protein